ncbi:MAG: entericidin A/B family lipoprotein [Sphingomonadaceae bacterium]|nr:entericidin A/B family lipoprotein [Sphingomonadaceae bacterium]
MAKKMLTIAVLLGGLAVAACNTVEGAGEDVESVGETVQDAAN